MTIARHLVFGSSFHAFEFALGNTRITAFFDSSNLQGFAHMTSTISKALVGACAALAIAGAHAATVTFTFNNALAPTEINQTGSLGLFDTSLGTLTGASLVFNGNAQSSITFVNTAANAADFFIESDMRFTIGSNLLPVSQFLTGLNGQFNVHLFSFDDSLPPGQPVTLPPVAVQSSLTKDLSTVLAGVSAPGGGTFGITCTSRISNTQGGGGGNTNVTQQTQARCGATITYTYTPAPPAPVNVPVGGAGTVALMGLAILGLAAGLRRKRR